MLSPSFRLMYIDDDEAARPYLSPYVAYHRTQRLAP